MESLPYDAVRLRIVFISRRGSAFTIRTSTTNIFVAYAAIYVLYRRVIIALMLRLGDVLFGISILP